jgi:uncharacterized protein (TIGR00251 family)
VIKLRVTADGVVVPVVSQPRSKRTRIIDFHAGAIKIAVSEPLQAGRANQAIMALLAELFGVPVSSLKLISGGQYRKKDILVIGGEIEAIRNALQRAVEG